MLCKYVKSAEVTNASSKYTQPGPVIEVYVNFSIATVG